MNAPSVTPRQLEQLFQNLEDCQITGAEHKLLMDLLRRDPAVRSAYIDHMAFVSLLHAKAEADAELQGAGEMEREARPARRFIPLLAAAAAMLLLIATAALLLRAPITGPVSITAGPNVSWHFTDGGLDGESCFLPGSRLALDVGSLDIRLGTGTELVLEGPAELGIVDPDTVELPTGRLWVRAASKEFTVRTTRLEIVDLGTEFGVLASGRLDEEVHVKRGSVRVAPKNAPLDPVILEASEAVRSDGNGALRRVPFGKAGFLQDLPPTLPYIHWSFDDSPDGQQFVSGGQGIRSSSIKTYSLDKSAPPPVERIPGRFGEALRLRGGGDFARASFEGIDGGVARSVAFWLRADPQSMAPELNPTLVAWGLPTEFGTKWRLVVDKKGSGFGTVWGGAWATSRLSGKRSIFDGQWHHLVYVFTGHHDKTGRPEILHYLDGEPLAVQNATDPIPVNTECGAKHSRPLTIGCQILSEPARQTFVGDLDELYVFRGVLSANQVRELHAGNRLGEAGVPRGDEPRSAE